MASKWKRMFQGKDTAQEVILGSDSFERNFFTLK
jgi:hypothetical protein